MYNSQFTIIRKLINPSQFSIIRKLINPSQLGCAMASQHCRDVGLPRLTPPLHVGLPRTAAVRGLAPSHTIAARGLAPATLAYQSIACYSPC
jgi:hypothetical protein